MYWYLLCSAPLCVGPPPTPMTADWWLLQPTARQASKANMAATQHFCASIRYPAFTVFQPGRDNQTTTQWIEQGFPIKMTPRSPYRVTRKWHFESLISWPSYFPRANFILVRSLSLSRLTLPRPPLSYFTWMDRSWWLFLISIPNQTLIM